MFQISKSIQWTKQEESYWFREKFIRIYHHAHTSLVLRAFLEGTPCIKQRLTMLQPTLTISFTKFRAWMETFRCRLRREALSSNVKQEIIPEVEARPSRHQLCRPWVLTLIRDLIQPMHLSCIGLEGLLLIPTLLASFFQLITTQTRLTFDFIRLCV